MAGYKFVVLSSPVAGREDEYNDWYSNRHLSDIVAIPGFSAAQRFALHSTRLGEVKQKYLAIYEMEVADLDAARQAMNAISQTEMEISEALDGESIATALFESCAPDQSAEGAEAGPFRMLAMTNAADGRDADFNQWYDGTHVPELLAAGGYASAERYRKRDTLTGGFDHDYLAVYSLSGKDWPSVERDMQKAAAVPLTLSDAARMDTIRLVTYEACCPRVMAPA